MPADEKKNEEKNGESDEKKEAAEKSTIYGALFDEKAHRKFLRQHLDYQRIAGDAFLSILPGPHDDAWMAALLAAARPPAWGGRPPYDDSAFLHLLAKRRDGNYIPYHKRRLYDVLCGFARNTNFIDSVYYDEEWNNIIFFVSGEEGMLKERVTAGINAVSELRESSAGQEAILADMGCFVHALDDKDELMTQRPGAYELVWDRDKGPDAAIRDLVEYLKLQGWTACAYQLDSENILVGIDDFALRGLPTVVRIHILLVETWRRDWPRAGKAMTVGVHTTIGVADFVEHRRRAWEKFECEASGVEREESDIEHEEPDAEQEPNAEPFPLASSVCGPALLYERRWQIIRTDIDRDFYGSLSIDPIGRYARLPEDRLKITVRAAGPEAASRAERFLLEEFGGPEYVRDVRVRHSFSRGLDWYDLVFTVERRRVYDFLPDYAQLERRVYETLKVPRELVEGELPPAGSTGRAAQYAGDGPNLKGWYCEEIIGTAYVNPKMLAAKLSSAGERREETVSGPIEFRRLHPHEIIRRSDELYDQTAKEWIGVRRRWAPHAEPQSFVGVRCGDLIARRRVRWQTPGKIRFLDMEETTQGGGCPRDLREHVCVWDPHAEHRRWLEARNRETLSTGLQGVVEAPKREVQEVRMTEQWGEETEIWDRWKGR